MRIDLITLFPEMCESFLTSSIIGRARENGYLQICAHQLRDYSKEKHKRVDDNPFGGGKGMLLKAEPIAECFDTLISHLGRKPYFIYMSPKGKTLKQKEVKRLSEKSEICILCGHYEGVDQRVLDEYIDEEISCGDYVLTGGEMPAVILIDSISRMVDGVLAEDECFINESHYNSLLEYPQYTRPDVWREKKVPEVLVSGNHAKIIEWQRKKSIEETLGKRPDMLKNAQLTSEEKRSISDCEKLKNI
jgi:tRNA (guanine37-N1)-methyltransferase